MKSKIKAVGLLSGGLDSTISAKLLLEQGIKVIGINFISPFFSHTAAIKTAKNLNIPLKIIKLEKKYIKMIRKPKHGYGKNMNPCIDCKIFMLKLAKKYAKKIKAKFIFTGEVLGQRPMSQNIRSLKLLEKEAGLKGKLLRPLSAKLLPPTQAEKKAWVDRKKLLNIHGRTRKTQLKLAKKYKIKGYSTPAGGCLLTYEGYSKKLKDLFKHKKNIKIEDVEFLKIGRHFRYKKNKIIVGRNEQENKQLLNLKRRDYGFEAKDYTGPVTLLQGKKTKTAIKTAACLTARYSDSKDEKTLIKYGKKFEKSITVEKSSEKEINKLRIT